MTKTTHVLMAALAFAAIPAAQTSRNLIHIEGGAKPSIAIPDFRGSGEAQVLVAVNGHKRTIMLPAAMAGYTPAAATFEDGALEVRFDG